MAGLVPRHRFYEVLIMNETFTVSSVALPARPKAAHKGDFGRVLIIAGSVPYTGAPSFAARGAVRAGAGLVFLGVPQAIHTIEAIKNDEAMVFPLPSDENGGLSRDAIPKILDKLNNFDICLIGPGLGMGDGAVKTVQAVIEAAERPLIIDADGINALALNIDILDRAKAPIVLTPHEGEFGRLGGIICSEGRLEAARSFAVRHGVTLVLKGSGTVTAFPDGDAFVNTTGNPGMAKGGSGDVLAGIISGLAPQLHDLKKAVPAAVFLHGRAGDLAAEALGEYAMTPSDIIGYLPLAMR